MAWHFRKRSPHTPWVPPTLQRWPLQCDAATRSHTRSAPYPSQTDINLAFYPESLYVIVGVKDRDAPDVRAFRIADGQVSEAELDVV